MLTIDITDGMSEVPLNLYPLSLLLWSISFEIATKKKNKSYTKKMVLNSESWMGII